MREEEQERIEFLRERYTLVFDRIREIREEERVPAPFLDYFKRIADFLLMTDQSRVWLERKPSQMTDWPAWQTAFGEMPLQWQCQNRNVRLYRDILPENYGNSYANPSYAVQMLGDTYGRILSALYALLREMIGYVYEGCYEEQVIFAELFVQVYTSFTYEEFPTYRELQQILYWFCSDYSELFVTRCIRKAVDRGLCLEDRSLCSVILQGTTALTGEMGAEKECDDAGEVINLQYVCDHREDGAMVLDKRFLERRLGAARVACETYACGTKKCKGGTNSGLSKEQTGKICTDGMKLDEPDRFGKQVAGTAEGQVAWESGGKAVAGRATAAQPQPAAYRFSQGQRRLIDKAKEEIAQIAEQLIGSRGNI